MHKFITIVILSYTLFILTSLEARSSQSLLSETKKQINETSMLIPLNGPIPAENWNKVNRKISEIVDSIQDPGILADLALWSQYCAPAEVQNKDRFFVYVGVRDASISRLAKLRSGAAKKALRKVKRNVLLDGSLATVVRAASKSLGEIDKRKASFSFTHPSGLEIAPLSTYALQLRENIIESFWVSWERNQAKNWSNTAVASCKVRINGRKAKIRSLFFSSKSRHVNKDHLSASIRQTISQWKLPERKKEFQDIDVGIVLE